MSKKSAKEIANDKSERIMDGVAYWASFYRHNPQRFVRDYLNVNLRLFQKILLYAMMHYYRFMYIAARGQGKTWLTSLFCVCRCILFPRTQICIASGTRGQANQVLSKIEDDFLKNYGWGSANLKREISYIKISANDSVCKFANGSWIKVVTASDTARGNRANLLILDEFRMIDRNTIDTVLDKFLTTTRQPAYLRKKQYKHMLEPNRTIYMSSAWMKDSWAFERAKSYAKAFFNDKKQYFICGLPYQVSIKEGLLMRSKIEDDMSENDFDEMSFSMEMESLWYGDAEGAFFSFKDVVARRKLKNAMYPPYLISNKSYKIPELVANERRILSVDVALMASTKHKNDASAILINSAIPTNNSYVTNVVYMDNKEGLNTDELALVVRRLYEIYKCTDLVIDTSGVGLGVYDCLIQDIVDPETGDLYRALSCYNNKEMADRCKVQNAPKVIWSIKGNASFNSEICTLLRNGFRSGKINLLIDENDADKVLNSRFRGFSKMPLEDQIQYKLPYVQTGLLVNELTKLEHEIRGTSTKIIEKRGMRKDRYSSLAYNYWVQCQLEREILRKPAEAFDVMDYASKMKKLNHRPNMY